LLFLYGTGALVSETVRITRQDIDFSRHSEQPPTAIPNNSDWFRLAQVPENPRIFEALKDQLGLELTPSKAPSMQKTPAIGLVHLKLPVCVAYRGRQ
jgi:hypothetical protein